MREPYGEDPASRPDPESCVRIGNGAGEALTGAHAGQPPSCEIRSSGAPTLLSEAEGHTEVGVIGEPPPDPPASCYFRRRQGEGRTAFLRSCQLHHP
jgi:hypothetical protein